MPNHAHPIAGWVSAFRSLVVQGDRLPACGPRNLAEEVEEDLDELSMVSPELEFPELDGIGISWNFAEFPMKREPQDFALHVTDRKEST